MNFTNSIELATVRLDPGFRFFGPSTALETVVTARLSGANRITHQSAWNNLSDGQRFHPGDDVAFRVPVVDQPGWVDGAGAPAAPWFYEVRVTASAPGKSTVKWFGSVAPTVGSVVVPLAPADGTATGVASGPGGSVNPATGHIVAWTGNSLNGSTTLNDLAASGE